MTAIQKTTLTLFLLLLSPLLASAQIGGHAMEQLKQLIQEGALNPLSPNDVRDTVGSSIVIAGDRNDIQAIEAKKYRWTDENVSKIADSLDAYMERYGIQLDARKQPLFLEHVQKFAAFKTAIFSSLPPSDELAQVVAGQIARGIRWANRPDIEYPNETQRRKAKDQIQQVLSELADALQTLTLGLGLEDIIQKETDTLVAGCEWRTDSPFFAIGKKVFSENELRALVEECLKLGVEKTDLKLVTPPDNLPPGQLQLFRHTQTACIRMAIHSASAPLAREYAKNTHSEPTREEQLECQSILARIEKIRKSKPAPSNP